MEKKYYEIEFKIKDFEQTFRHKKISATKLLALSTIFNPTMSVEDTEYIFAFALENTEVFLKNSWFNVKQIIPGTNDSVYMPVNLEDNLAALQEIITHFIDNVIKVVFIDSNKSTK